MGTVMIWNDNGTIKNTLVLDAMYRGRGKHINNGDVPGMSYYTKTGLITGSVLPSPHGPQAIPEEDYIEYFTDDKLNNNVKCNQDTQNSKYNTDKLIAFDSDITKAPGYCRSITVNGIGCDLPTLNCLTRIFADGVYIDSLDPTIDEYPDYKLSTWQIGVSGSAWSSSLSSSKTAFNMDASGSMDSTTRGNRYLLGIFPVLDL